MGCRQPPTQGRAMAACFELVLAYATSASGPHHLGCPAISSSKSSAVRCFDHANTSYFISFFVWPISRLSNRTSRQLDGVPWQVEKRIVGDRRCYPLLGNARSPAPLLLIWKDLAKTLKTISLLYWDEAHRSEAGRGAVHSGETYFRRPQITPALSECPSAPPADLERSCQDSQDYLAALLGLSLPESDGREVEPPPLSPFSQEILYRLEIDPSLSEIDQTNLSTPDPALTRPDPPTDDQFLRPSSPSNSRRNLIEVPLVFSLRLQAHSQEPQGRVEYGPESGGDANSIVITQKKVGFAGVGGQCGVQLEEDVTAGSTTSQSKKRSAERSMGQPQRKKLAGSIPLSFVRLKHQTEYRVEALLQSHFVNFWRKVQECEAVNCGEKVAYPDPSLKIVMTRSNRQTAVVFRILDASKVLRIQRIQPLDKQYKFLLRYLSKHCEDSLKIAAVLTRDHLATLFGWIDEKIYGSGTGPALIGMRTSSELAWQKDDKFDDTQKKLITYFSQSLKERGDYVPTLADFLVEEFRAQYGIVLSNLSDDQGGIPGTTAITNWSRHSGDQFTGTTNSSTCYLFFTSNKLLIIKDSKNPAPQDPSNLSQECTDLDPKVDIHASTITKQNQSTPKINSNQVLQHNSPVNNMQMSIPQYLQSKDVSLGSPTSPSTGIIDHHLQILKDSLSNFSRASSEFNIQGKNRRITYPGLNIGMFNYFEEPSVKVLKVLNASKGHKMQRTSALVPLYKCLLHKMYMCYNQLLKSSKIADSQHINYHRRLFKWLEVKILGPSSGLPILGKRTSTKLVWMENDKYDASQVVLINFLSGDVYKKHELADKAAKILLEMFLSQDENSD
ncbi:hypothetical protein PSHT_11123 [Puccinia striiformis]|uniref:Uncharacterized protein n=1 Tax=Puccinia striiformis TaxID=27350 RepID=A0A2S4V5G4_9BASI|nr:hypothetical protein PSHT_11123 [Puccinia striiformis]